MHFLLWTEGSHQGPYFDTTECSGENLPNSSCHFPNYKSVFLQTLHHSSVSWKITCLYFFQSNVIHFVQKGTSQKANFWGFWVVGSKFTKFLSFLKQHTSFSSNFASCFRDMRHNSSVPLYLKFFTISTKRAYQNLVKFYVSSWKSNILHFSDGLPLTKSFKVSAKKVLASYLSWHWRVMQS